MAIGDTVQAGLMRVDFSPFLEAGRANAAANASFGQALGQVAKGYIEGQEKKARANEIAGFLMGQGVSEKDAQAIAKNPFLQNEYQRGQEAKAKMKMEKERLATQANIAAQGRAARQAEIDQKYEREDAKKAEIEQEEALIDRFLSLPTTQNIELDRTDTNPLMRNVAGPTTQVQGGYEGTRFLQTEDGKNLYSRMIDEGLDPSNSLKQMQSFEARLLANQPKAPDPFKVRDELRKTTEFEQGQDVITFTPGRNSIQLGDTAYGISGKFGDEAEVIKLKSVEIPNYSNMNSVMNQLISLGEKRKTTKFMSNADKTLAQSLSNQLRGLLREQILGPGTVTDPERAILNEIVQNPTTWMDTAGDTQSKIDSLKGIRKDAFNKLKTRLTGLGLDVAEIEQGGASSPSKSSVDFDQETSSGLGYTEINLDQL